MQDLASEPHEAAAPEPAPADPRDLEIARLRRLYVALSRVNRCLVTASSQASLFDGVCAALVDGGAFVMAWVGWVEAGTGRVLPVARRGAEAGYLDGIVVYADDRPEGRGPTGTAAREGRPLLCNDIQQAEAMAPFHRAAGERGFRSSAAFPIREAGVVRGVLNVYASEPGYFRGEEVALLDEAASDVSFALDNLARDEARRAADEAFRLSEGRYRALFERAPEGMLMADAESRTLAVNPAACRIFGRTRDELLAVRAGETMRRAEPGEAEAMRRAVAERGYHEGETTLFRGDGSPFPADVVVTALPGGNFVGMVRDVSERKANEQALRDLAESLEREVERRTAELRAAVVRAESADRIKSAFLATMSHELRTPLNSIIGFTGILLQGLAGPLVPEQEKQLGMVRDSARHLLALINDVLDISKLEAKQLAVRPEPFDFDAAVSHVVASVWPLAERKELTLGIEAHTPVGHVTTDRRRVEQILLNLLQNGIKFTERGGVRVVVERAASQTGDVVRVAVVDTGVGIEEAGVALLFQPFRQLDVGLSRTHEGTGLGLAICRRLAEALGGSITVESAVGRGSTFTLTLPVHLRQGAEP